MLKKKYEQGENFNKEIKIIKYNETDFGAGNKITALKNSREGLDDRLD